MTAPIPLRADFDAATLRALAKRSRDPDQTRRLLALAAIYDGHARSHAAQLAGVGPQIVRDWVLRFGIREPAGGMVRPDGMRERIERSCGRPADSLDLVREHTSPLRVRRPAWKGAACTRAKLRHPPESTIPA